MDKPVRFNEVVFLRRILLYPFSDQSLPLCQYFSVFSPEDQITAVVSPLGLGMDGHDAYYISNRPAQGIKVRTDLQQAIAECDALIVPFGNLKDDPIFQDAFDVMCYAAKKGKEVFCGSKLTSTQLKHLKEISKSLHYGFHEKATFYKKVVYGSYKPSVPIVFIHNLTMEADSFEVTLAIAQRFQRDGYRVSVVGARPEYNFLGMNGSSMMLDWFYGNQKLSTLPGTLQIFQHYLHSIEIDQNPDIILLNFPGAAIPIQELYPNESGVFAYIMSQTVRPDFSLVCMPFSDPTTEALQVVDKELCARFGIGLNAVHLSNRMIHAEQARHTGKEQSIYVTSQQAIQKAKGLREQSLPVFSALIEEEKEGLYRFIMNRLQS